MALTFIHDSTEAIDLSKVEYINVHDQELRMASGKVVRLKDEDFARILVKLKEGSK